MKHKFNVKGMTCSACSANVEKTVKKLAGVGEVNVNLLSNSMAVEYDEDICKKENIIAAVSDAGYSASIMQQGVDDSQKIEHLPNESQGEIESMKKRIVVSFVFLIPLIYISMGGIFFIPRPSGLEGVQNALAPAFLQFLLILPIVYTNRKYYQVGFRTLLHRAPNMDSLIAVSSSAALLYGIYAIFQIGYGLGHNDWGLAGQYAANLYFDSAAMILSLVTLGKFMEERSKGRTSEAISKLIDLAPRTAVVIRDGFEHEIPARDVAVGEIVVLKPGQSIPVDGVVLEGFSSVDQSALTGESMPVEKCAGDRLFAATINKSGYLKFRAEKVGENTTLAQIIQLVEEAGASKAPIGRLADKISGIFVPVVMLIALVSVIAWLLGGQSFEFALSIGITVLVISCPCALGLATPLAIMVGTGVGAENGILIKSAEYLEQAHKINTVVLDKTGTITEGRPELTDIITANESSELELMVIAASMEKASEHPLADAITAKAVEKGIELKAVEEFSAIPGRGISAIIDGQRYIGGNLLFMQENGIDIDGMEDISHSIAESGKTPLYFAGDRFLGLIAAADSVKATSRAAIECLKSMGIEVVMMTGDNEKTAAAIEKQLGIDRTIAEVFPQDKEREIQAIQQEGKKVAMIGDGINDAPALVRADVGIAIGAGTDIAIESADIVLIKSDLLDAVAAIELSKAVIRNIKQNLFWAFFYNSIGIPLAAGVFYSPLGWTLSPMIAAAAMSISSVSVVSNALRLKLFRPSTEIKINESYQSVSNNGGERMEKVISINGMNCAHCQAAVEKALNSIENVEARVDLKEKIATVNMDSEIANDVLKNAVEEAGFEVVAISRK